MKLTNKDKLFFEKNGYLILKKFFNYKETDEYINHIKKTFKINELKNDDIMKCSYKLTDGVTKQKNFWDIITNSKLTDSIKFLLDGEICYAQHSDLHVNNRGGRWHRDSKCRVFGEGTDWIENKDKYGIVRVAIYLSEYSLSNSSLILFPKSHKSENFFQKFEFRFINKLISYLKKINLQEYFPNISLTRKLVKHNTNAGDVVIFDQRIVHGSGNIGKTKKMPKFSIFLAYGLRNIHTINHKKYYVHEKNLDYQKNIDNQLKQILKDKNLDYLYN